MAAYQQALKYNIQGVITTAHTAQLYRDLADLLLSMNRWPEASQALKNSLSLDPDNPETQQRIEALPTP